MAGNNNDIWRSTLILELSSVKKTFPLMDESEDRLQVKKNLFFAM